MLYWTGSEKVSANGQISKTSQDFEQFIFVLII